MASANQGVQLCEECNAILNRLDELSHLEDSNHDVQGRIQMPFKPLALARLSSESGCKICSYLINRYDGGSEGGSDGNLKLAVDLFLPTRLETVSFIRFTYPESELESDIAKYHYVAAGLDIQEWTANGAAASKLPSFGHSSDSDETFSQVVRWIATCDQQHKCLRWNLVNGVHPTLSTRLLEIEVSGGNTTIRLVASNEMSPETRYLTLSHCWGKNMPLRLTADTYGILQKGLPAASLPPTFRDAVSIACRLSVKYLWIDSICIFQDSLDDWSSEAKQMAKVYSNGYLNIAASDSRDSFGGIFRSRDPTYLQSFSLRSQTGRAFICHHGTAFEDLINCPLSERAWILQERFLSPRVVHFCGQQVHWDSSYCLTSESLPAGLPCRDLASSRRFKTLDFAADIFENRSSDVHKHQLFAIWDGLLKRYTRANLTFPSDKAIAMHSLALAVCGLLGYDIQTAYVNGIWRAQFINGLMWRSRVDSYRSENGSCSWSWFSMHGMVLSHSVKDWENTISDLDQHVPITELLEVQADCTLVTPNAAAGGSARVRGPLCQAILSTDLVRRREHDLKHFHDLRLGDKVLAEEECMYVSLDECETACEPEAAERQLYLMLGRAKSRVGKLDHCFANPGFPCYGAGEYECLLLQPVSTALGHFRRVGYVHFKKTVCFGITEAPEDVATHDLAIWRLLDSHFRSYDVPGHLYHEVNDDFMYTITLV